MAEQVYVYGASQGVRPGSYSYGSYGSGDSAGTQPVYNQGQSYSYESGGYAASSLAVAPTGGYGQSDPSQPQYTVQVVAGSQGSYGAQQSSAYATSQSLPGASPYATSVVSPGYNPQQPTAAYVQQPQGQTIYGQVQMQAPAGQPGSTYGIAGSQPAYGQPQIGAGQPAGLAYAQQSPAQGQPGQTVIYGQAAGQPGIAAAQQAPVYGQPVIQAGAAFAQPPPGQPQLQAAAPQQTVYMLPAAGGQPAQYAMPPGQPAPVAAYRPALGGAAYGRSMSPVDLIPYDQRPLNLPPAPRGPPGALVGPSVVLNAVLGGPRPSFGRGRDDMGRGYGGYNRNDGGGTLLDDTLFIQGLPETTTEELLAKHFAVAGPIKLDKTGKPRVWMCRDKMTGRPRGDGIVGYDMAQSATIAIERFHKSDFLGAIINVRHATKKPPGQTSRGGRSDDWVCSVGNCGNHNFGWRTECNRCKAPRPPSDKDGVDGVDGMDGRGSPRYGGRGGSGRIGGAPIRTRDGGNRGGPMRGRDRFERRDHPY